MIVGGTDQLPGGKIPLSILLFYSLSSFFSSCFFLLKQLTSAGKGFGFGHCVVTTIRVLAWRL
jgi:hypothetical protein